MDPKAVRTLCNNDMNESQVIIPLGPIQLQTFIDKSKARKDGCWVSWEGAKSVKVHDACRKRYSAKPHKPPPEKTRRTNSPEPQASYSNPEPESPSSAFPTSHPPGCSEFNFSDLCFICGNRLDPYHKEIRRVQDPMFSNKLLQIAESRDDDVGEEINNRLQGHISLVGDCYHKTCYNRFVQPIYERQPADNEAIEEAFRRVTSHMENSTTYQFGVKELRSIMACNSLSDTILFKKLKHKHGDDIHIERHKGRETKIYYKKLDLPKICSDWFCDEGSINKKQKETILNVAADILRTEIRNTDFQTESYSTPTQFLKSVSTDIPRLLQTFLDQLLYKNKLDEEDQNCTKRDAIAHSIITAIRPKSFISNLQLAIGLYIHRKTGSKLIIDLLAKMGVCASYYSITLFERCTIMDPPKMNIEEDSFVQFVFDNTDHNVVTLDGRETFHCLGGIAVYTPEEYISYEGGSKKLQKMPSAAVIASQKRIPIIPYESSRERGMKDLTFEPTASLHLGEAPLLPSTFATYLWGKNFNIKLPSWRGYMEVLSSEESLSKRQSHIVCLPFINAPPSNLTTLHSALNLAVGETEKIGQKTTFLTFDQPLYWKSRSIVATLTHTSFKNTVVLLGIFHLLMSYLGAIGYTMEGSGLEDLWSVVYAPESVKKMLTGHAFSRAFRAHILTFTALGMKICSMINAPPKWRDFMYTFLHDWRSKTRGDCKAEMEIGAMTRAFEEKLRMLENIGSTSKLWIQYFKCVLIALQLIEAERLGNWELHLQSVRNTLPLFHAAGHHAYAKTAQIYLQDMANLELFMDPNEYDAFTRGGYFTIRRTDKAWAGVSRDMVIEQTLNRFFGTDLKHGRGVTPSVVSRYLLAMPAAFNIMEQLEEYCSIKTANSEQHVDLSPSRIERDEQDIQKLSFWLDSHNPFNPRNSLVSLSTGVIGGPRINCHMAIEKGLQSMASMIGKNPENVTISQLYKVKNLASATDGVHLNREDSCVKIDSYLLFQKISVIFNGNEELTQRALNHELSPAPLSLFDEKGWMRQSKKSELYTILTPAIQSQSLLDHCKFVIDGGWLLRQVFWPHGKIYGEIFELYQRYIVKYFRADAIVIFDGYKSDVIGVKSYERLRRKEKFMAADVDIGEDKMMTITQSKFLSNVVNKFKFVKLLAQYLNDNHIQTQVAEEDADGLIIRTAINIQSQRRAEEPPIVVVGNDVDLLVLLIGLTPDEESLTFYKITSTGKKDKVQYWTRDHKNLKPFILFAHAFVGCDSTSAIYKKGKKTIISIINRNQTLRESVSVFYRPNSTVEDLYTVAENVMKHLYITDDRTKLPINELRYRMFISSVAGAKKDVLSSLPPTKSALQEHAKRVYFQIQQWLGYTLDPLHWGWERIGIENVVLIPKKSELKAAPDDLLAMVSCGCARTKCTTAVCVCKKAGLHCTQICRHCVDKDSCLNKPVEDVNEISEESEHELAPGILSDTSDSDCETNAEIPQFNRESYAGEEEVEERELDYDYY